MKLTTSTARALALAVALTAVGATVAAGDDPHPTAGGTQATRATSTTGSSHSMQTTSSSSSSSSSSTSTSSGGTSTCQTHVVVKVDGQARERTERSSGRSCSTRVQVRDRRVTLSGSASADGPLTAARAARLARSALERALGGPLDGRVRCSAGEPRRMTCTAAGRHGVARLTIRRHGSGDAARWSYRGEVERP